MPQVRVEATDLIMVKAETDNFEGSYNEIEDLSNSEDAVVVGPTIRITMEHISISITHRTHNQNNMVLPAVYAVDSTIPPSTATRVNMT